MWPMHAMPYAIGTLLIEATPCHAMPSDAPSATAGAGASPPGGMAMGMAHA